jgi:hypothetical protein
MNSGSGIIAPDKAPKRIATGETMKLVASTILLARRNVMKIQYRSKRKASGEMPRSTNLLRRSLPALVVAVLSALCILPRANAQKPISFPFVPSRFTHASDAQIRAHIARARGQVLTDDDVNNFQNNMQNLVNWMGQVPTSDPNQQAAVNDVQQQINGLTPVQMSQFAGYADVNAFNNAVNTLVGTVPATRILPSTDPPSTLFPPQYGICQPTNGPPEVPSDASVDLALSVVLDVLTAIQVVADDDMNLFVSILGEDDNLVEIIIGIVIDEVVFAIQTVSAQIQFCDPYDQAAEVEAGWQNTIVIDYDIANLKADAANQFTILENQLTSIDNDIDNHLSSIAGNTNPQYSQINNELTAITTNFTNQVTGIDLDIDNHVAAFTVAVGNTIASVDADVKNITTSLTTNVNGELAKLDSDVLNQAGLTNTAITGLQTLDVSLDIQHALAAGLSVGLFELPSSQGGYIQTLRAIVANAISSMTAAGQSVGTAAKSLAQGDAALAASQYKTAYQDYLAAYQAAK